MTYSWIRAVIVSAVVISLGVLVSLSKRIIPLTELPLVVHVPFVFSNELDPRSISTVGDQMVSEHIFAFHARESQTQGFGSVFSDIQIKEESNEILLRPRFTLKSSDGTVWSKERICSSIRASLKGTAHAPVGDFVEDVRCELDGVIRVKFSILPVNIRYLFTLSDFSIFDVSQLPLSKDRLFPGNGPYRIKQYDTRQVLLEANSFYPSSLKANTVKEVLIKSYPAADAQALFKSARTSPQDPFLGYFYGYSLSENDTVQIRNAGFKIRQIPSEWLLYWGFGKNLREKDRAIFFQAANSWRDEMTKVVGMGQPAYSLSPADRPFGLSREEFQELIPEISDLASLTGAELSRVHTLATLEEWASIPVVAAGIRLAQSRFKNLRVELLSRSNAGRLWSGEIDFILSPLGISPADPVNNFAFQSNFHSVVPLTRLTRLSAEKDVKRFNEGFKQVEKDVLRAQLWVPIAHFPGVVVEHPVYERDEELSWSWGIQAWTYRVKSN